MDVIGVEQKLLAQLYELVTRGGHGRACTGRRSQWRCIKAGAQGQGGRQQAGLLEKGSAVSHVSVHPKKK
ncbi:hypothetical protein D3C76_1726940 [compost metagenome]